MKTLYLLRHAKSDWTDERLTDFQRPLNARGRRSADALGAYIAEVALPVGPVLCSTAVRTRETVSRMASLAPQLADVTYLDDLYLAGTSLLFDLVCDLPEKADKVMLVGHNPGLHALGVMLAHAGPPEELDRLYRKFATGALLELALDIQQYRHAQAECGRVVRFIRPKALLRDGPLAGPDSDEP